MYDLRNLREMLCRRDAMGRYSRTDARDHMRAQLEDMMRDADDDKTREAIRRCMEQIDRA